MKDDTPQVRQDKIDETLDNISAIYHQYEKLVEKAEENNMEDRDKEFFLSEAFELGSQEARLWRKVRELKADLNEKEIEIVEDRMEEVI